MKPNRKQYEDYISSEAWHKKRKVFIKNFAGSGCYICAKSKELGFHVHHVTYVRFGNEKMKDLRLVCEPCHVKIHEIHRTSEKLSLLDVTENLAKKAKQKTNKTITTKPTIQWRVPEPKYINPPVFAPKIKSKNQQPKPKGSLDNIENPNLKKKLEKTLQLPKAQTFYERSKLSSGDRKFKTLLSLKTSTNPETDKQNQQPQPDALKP